MADRQRVESVIERGGVGAPSVTVVVCTRNRAEGLRRALESLTKLDVAGLRVDVLVVDNGSTDHTAGVVEEVAATSSIPVARVFEPTPGVANARQRGVTETRGDWIAFFDDDQLAEPDWLHNLFALAAAKDAKFVGGRVVLSLPEGHAGRDLAPFTRMLLGASVGMPAACRYDMKTTPGAGNMLVHREVFERVGPFDPALHRGEDTDFYMRAVDAGFAAWYTPDAVVHHCIPADRMNDAYLYRLCDVIGNGTAERDFDRFGRMKLSAVWIARLGQTALSLFPLWAWAKLTEDAEGKRGRRCRLRVARRYLRDTARFVVGLPVETV
ncbi:glycosyltransferase family 2 protein [Alienimonas californiensis]|uniref:Glycosyltransferase EpsH n=1 Tax=Alienimonas californiensis TaxID=2527989 RepID=A0A517PEF9_9PLAN|nr:glycosyltransferase [Alienimonas californiensis]QDT17757.1 Putative glycosyltransferase EpsH [Alienimonas californiensis]